MKNKGCVSSGTQKQLPPEIMSKIIKEVEKIYPKIDAWARVNSDDRVILAAKSDVLCAITNVTYNEKIFPQVEKWLEGHWYSLPYAGNKREDELATLLIQERLDYLRNQ